MDIKTLRGLTVEEQFRKVAEFAGVKPETLDRQWATESGRGKNLIGPETKWGRAKGHFQFIDDTANAISDKMGFKFDPNDFSESLLAAGYLWKENMAMFGGDEKLAAAAYHGGPNRKQWGPVTAAYVNKLTGENIPDSTPDATIPKVVKAKDLADEIAFGATELMAAQDKAREGQAGLRDTLVVEASKAADEAVERRQREIAQSGSLFTASMADRRNNVSLSLLAAIERPAEQNVPKDYDAKAALAEDFWKYNFNDDEVELAREVGASGPEGRQEAINRILMDREINSTYGEHSGLKVFGVNALTAGISDPVGLLSGVAVFKAMHRLGRSSGALVKVGRPGAAVAAATGEAALGNVAVEGLADVLGEHKTAGDYFMASTIGAAFTTPFLRGTYRNAAEQALKNTMDDLRTRVLEPEFVGPRTPQEQAQFELQAAVAEAQSGRTQQTPIVPKELHEELEAGINPPEEEPIPVGEATEVDQDVIPAFKSLESAASGVGGGVLPNWNRPDFVQARLQKGVMGFYNVAIEALSKGVLKGYDDRTKVKAGVTFHPDMAANPKFTVLKEAVDSLAARFLPGERVFFSDSLLAKSVTTKAEIVTVNDLHVIGVREQPEVDAKTEQTRILRSGIHELGHAVFHKWAPMIPAPLLDAMKVAHLQLVNDIRSGAKTVRKRRFSGSNPGFRGADPIPLTEYTGSFDEYAAEQFVKYVERTLAMRGDPSLPAKALEVIKTAMKKIAEFFNVTKERGWLDPDETFEQFFESILDGSIKRVNNAESTPEFLDAGLAIPEADATQAMATPAGGYNPGAVISAKRKFAQKLQDHARNFIKQNPIDMDRLNVLTQKMGGALSDGLRLAGSKNPIMQMVASMITETTTGAAGRRATVTLRAHGLKSYFIGDGLTGYQAAYDSYKGRNGGGLANDLFSGDVRRKFDREVMLELLGRREVNYTPNADPSVRSAADGLEEGFERARKQQVDSNVLGNANLPTTAKGYVPQSLNGRRLAEATPQELADLEAHLAHRFAGVYGWKLDISKDIARTYVTRARSRVQGGDKYSVPAEDPASPIKESLEELKKGAQGAAQLSAIVKAEIAFSDRGLGQTKARLDVGLTDRLPNGKLVLDYFEDNPAHLYQRYAHRTAGNVAFTEFGVQGPTGLRYLREAAETTLAPGENVSAEELEAFDRVVAELMGNPIPGASVSEPALAARLLVGTQRLGGLVFTQAAETFNMLHHLGLTSTLKGVAALPRMISEVGRLKKGAPSQNRLLTSMELMSGEFGMDSYKLRMPLDPPDDRLVAYSAEQSVITRLLQGGSHLQQKVSFFRGLMAAQHRAVAEQIVLKAVRYIHEGGPTNDKYLSDMGFTPSLVTALRQSRAWYQLDASGKVVSLNAMAIPGGVDREAFTQAVHRGVGQIIQQTFVGERGAWLHNDYVQLLAQLRTFGLTAMEKQWGRTVSNSGYAKAAGIMLAQMALATPIHLARVHLNSALMDEEERKKYIEQNAGPAALVRASMNYASTSALFGDAWELGAAFAAGWANDKEVSDTLGVRGGSGGAVSRAVPIVGSIDQAARVASGQGSLYQALKQLPGSNLWYLAPFIGLTKED